MTVSVEILDPRGDPEPPGWSEFRQRQQLYPVWDYELLGIEAWMSRNPALLVLARDSSGVVVAAMSAMVCRWRRSPAYARPPTARAARLAPRWVEPYLPWLSEPAFVLDGALDEPAKRDMVRRMEQGLRRRVGAGLLGVLYRNVPAAAMAWVAGAGRLTREVQPPSAVLDNRWKSAEGWLADLSRNRRKSVRQVDRLVAADPSLLVRGGPARTDLDGAELAALLRAHRARYPKQLLESRTPIAGAYLDALVRRADVHTLTYSDGDGRLLAFCLMLDHPSTPVACLWASRSRADGGRPHLYFDCQARAIRFTIATGRKELTAGRGRWEEKRSLGFQARRRWLVAVPRPMVGR
jgi:uncharacterized protein